MNENVCPFCGASSENSRTRDSTHFNCETVLCWMTNQYHQSDRCKENIKKKEVENESI